MPAHVASWLIISSLVLLVVPDANAQGQTDSRFGIDGYVTFGATLLSAGDTFEAASGSRTRGGVGGGMQLRGLWRRVFADVGVTRHSIDGERVFADEGRVFRVGIPLEATMLPVDVAGGWRFHPIGGRFVPYAGAGVTYVHYREASRFAGSSEELQQGSVGPLIIGGIDLRVWRWLSAGGDVRWRRATGILGERGVSSEFDEDDAGGLTLAVRLAVGSR